MCVCVFVCVHSSPCSSLPPPLTSSLSFTLSSSFPSLTSLTSSPPPLLFTTPHPFTLHHTPLPPPTPLHTPSQVLDLSKVKHFILDECDRLLAELDMRRDVQTIFMATPHEKQVRHSIALPCDAIPYHVMPYYAIPYNALWSCHSMSYYAFLYHDIKYHDSAID